MVNELNCDQMVVTNAAILDPRSSPASNTGHMSGRGTRRLRGTRTFQLAGDSISRGSESKQSPDHGTEDDQNEREEGMDGIDTDKDDGVAVMPKSTSKSSKAENATPSKRRSGRKR